MVSREQHIKLKLEKICQCPICLDVLKGAKILNCQHTFCQSCLESTCLQNDLGLMSLFCPTCRTRQPLVYHKSDVSRINGSLFVNQVLELLKEWNECNLSNNNNNKDNQLKEKGDTYSNTKVTSVYEAVNVSTMERIAQVHVQEYGSRDKKVRQLESENVKLKKNNAVLLMDNLLLKMKLDEEGCTPNFRVSDTAVSQSLETPPQPAHQNLTESITKEFEQSQFSIEPKLEKYFITANTNDNLNSYKDTNRLEQTKQNENTSVTSNRQSPSSRNLIWKKYCTKQHRPHFKKALKWINRDEKILLNAIKNKELIQQASLKENIKTALLNDSDKETDIVGDPLFENTQKNHVVNPRFQHEGKENTCKQHTNRLEVSSRKQKQYVSQADENQQSKYAACSDTRMSRECRNTGVGNSNITNNLLKTDKEKLLCWRCFRSGHSGVTCKEKTTKRGRLICDKCNFVGHEASTCNS